MMLSRLFSRSRMTAYSYQSVRAFSCPYIAENLNQKPKKIIIDTDMGWDDVLSIAYLLKHPKVDVIGITVVGNGEGTPEASLLTAGHLLNVGNHSETVLSMGVEEAVDERLSFPELFRVDMDYAVGTIDKCNIEKFTPDSRKAWEFIEDTVRESDEKVTILSIGGFSNIAKYLKIASCPEKIEMIYAMAGAVHVAGNISEVDRAKDVWSRGLFHRNNTVAEFNVFVDPFSASEVFKSKVPLFLVPLDACNKIELDPTFVNLVTAKDKLAVISKAVLEAKVGDHNESLPGREVPMFDPIAALVAAGDLCYKQVKAHLNYLEVRTELDIYAADVYIVEGTKDDRKIYYAQDADKRVFEEKFFEGLNREPKYEKKC